MIVDHFGKPAPFGAGIAEAADEFLLLGVDADDGRRSLGALGAERGNDVELRVPVGMGSAGEILAVDSKRVAGSGQQSGDGSVAEDNAVAGAKRLRDGCRRATRPPQTVLRIAAYVGFEEPVDQGLEFGVFFSLDLRPPPRLRTRSA